MASRKPGRLTAALLEAADDMRRLGVMDAATHKTLTLRHLGDTAESGATSITGDEIRALREEAHIGRATISRMKA